LRRVDDIKRTFKFRLSIGSWWFQKIGFQAVIASSFCRTYDVPSNEFLLQSFMLHINMYTRLSPQVTALSNKHALPLVRALSNKHALPSCQGIN
jgi:hypothetical protein